MRVRLAIGLLAACLGCRRVELSLEARSCDARGQCAEGYSCNDRNVCVVDGSDDCAVGTPQHCRACGDDCGDRPFVQAATCDATRTCVVSICYPGRLDANGDGEDGCELECDSCQPALRDVDHDGFGTGQPQCACLADPVFTARVGGDCDDDDPATFPGAPERCDGNKNDCDAPLFPAGERDADLDGAVGCAPFVDTQGDQPGLTGGDCDDGDQQRGPATVEQCNGVIDGCAAALPADEVDGDGDGYVDCTPVSGSAVLGADCDDTRAAVSPAGAENLAVDGSCDDGLDNDCDGATDAAPTCASVAVCVFDRLRPLRVAAATAVTAGYSAALVFDHGALVSAGQSRADGADVRIFWWSGAAFVEVDRVLDPRSSWNSASTRLWFRVQRQIVGTIDEYVLAYDDAAPPPPLADERNVFHFADFFDRADADVVGGGWTELEEATDDVDVAGNALRFQVTNESVNRPLVQASFAPLAQRLSWTFGFNWNQGSSPSDDDYLVLMQLGDGLMPPATDSGSRPDQRGVAASLVWYGVDFDGSVYTEELGAYEPSSQFNYLRKLDGSRVFELDVRPLDRLFDLSIDGTSVESGMPFVADVAQVSQVRFHTSSLDETEFTSRRFTFTFVRPLVDPEPATSLGTVRSTRCP